ncbi:NlpC/P60 family protein [Amycolatopsis rhabdoformis]|uniref:NlpC/P60 family protein n=1 Tax=Amycolatopsis rhabdoformis TaxID=1448059 RepID=A0ABZ1HY95_9PSEU|nr:NlpC/P60 family protein [Amycolatopsis rhabdoformis]WSE27088.1 NlpC/P60 family protein [Amycolatopsis rhabdoformis]
MFTRNDRAGRRWGWPLALAVVVVAGVAQPSATAAPEPTPLTKYRDLSRQAEKLSQDLLGAQADLDHKQADLDRAGQDLAAAKTAGQSAAADKARRQVDVDKFAGAAFTGNAAMNRLSSLLGGDSISDYLQRSSALDLVAANQQRALDTLADANRAADAATAKATDAQHRAQTARDAAAKLKSDIQARQKSLDDQLHQLESAAHDLTSTDREAQHDQGDTPPPIHASGAAQAAIDAAMSRLGKPYVTGGTGPNSFDCSGLMLWAYARAGISLPRTSRAQSTFGTPIPRSQLQPGDLVFYYSPVSHVGMYLGDGKMIHAPDTGDVVKISPLQSQYAGARRP